ncbi:DUF624 domain-containing protein [Streptococcus sp. DD13]|uniref:DUF624 domain-containing protein n=1 Tax=Streptococcus sp. DD13 TaxID=1777881 RepID=UPI00079AF9A9|nr:DUF624 domain-containing protein [Streptococcus sp. DD13]KXT78961.1 hypothetical protein STRDD13_00304 [Streptococcus sp. DD13]
MGKLIDFIFQRVFMAMLASGIFLVLALCGGLVLGIAPAGSVLMTLFAQYRYNYKQYKWTEAWTLFKENFVRSNQIFYTFFVTESAFLYGIYLIIQVPQSILTVLVTIFNLVFAVIIPLGYAVYLKLQVYFDMSYFNSLKLSFIGMFLSLLSMFKILIGAAIVLMILYLAPALVFFVFIGAWHFFISDLLEPVYQVVSSSIVAEP